MPRTIALWFCLALAGAAATAENAPAARPPLAVVADFPGGSANVVSIDQARRFIRLRPADHPGRGWRVWWYFKVTGIRPGETISLEVTADGFGLPDRAATSTDDRRWTQTAAGARTTASVTYRQKVDAAEAWFAWGPPYLPRDAQELIARAEKSSPQARGFELCRTLEDRPVPALRLTPPGETAGRPVGLWVQARQHAWETGGSWVAQGFTEWLLSGDPRAESLRRKAALVIVPIMDVDNVVRGAGGKNESPQDHNRDWSDHPHWPSVLAAQRAIRKMIAEGRLAVFMDLHNPGPKEHEMYFYSGPRNMMTPEQKTGLDAFLKAALLEMKGPPPFKGAFKETGPAYDPEHWQEISKNWVNRQSPGAVALTLETGWNMPCGTADGYRQVGRQLGLTLERYLMTRDEPPPPVPNR